MSCLCRLMTVIWFSTSLAFGQSPDAPAASASTPARPPAVNDEPPLPKLKDMVLPSVEELLRGKPTDWIVMVNQDVLVVEPVSPRPGTLEERKAKYDALQKVPVTEIDLNEKLRRLSELQRIVVTLPDVSEDTEYLLEMRLIQEIIFFETKILRRIKHLLDDGELSPAYELLMFLERRHPGWPGFLEEYLRYLFLEAGQLADAAEWEQAWISANRLFQLKPDFLHLSRLLGQIADGAIAQAVSAEDFRRARFHLGRLRSLQPDHRVVLQWQEKLSELGRRTMQQAQRAASDGQHREAVLKIELAAVIWPALPGLKETHRQLIGRYQILRSGVLQPVLPETSPVFSTRKSRRQQSLTQIALFEPDTIGDGIVRFRSRWFDAWEPRDLGREITFQLKRNRADWESRSVISTGDIYDLLMSRIDRNSPEYDAQLANEIVSVSIQSPEEWTLQLSRIPRRIESQLRFPVQFRNNQEGTPLTTVKELSGQRFSLVDSADGRSRFVRTRLQPEAANERHIVEVLETTDASWDKLVQALLRHELDYLPHAEWRDVDAFSRDKRFTVLQSALPETHVLQIHPESILATNPTWRRALLFALNRQEILESAILKGARPDFGRLVTGPFATNLSAYHWQLRHPEPDPLQAASLASTVRKQMKSELPTLRLLVPGDAVTQRAVPLLISQWRRVGVKVEAVSDGEGASWDLAYRTVQFTEPLEDIWSLLTPTGETSWQNLANYPHWLRERLWELEQTIDWPTANRLLREIQGDFLHEARWIPLWELDQFHILRRHITGVPQRPLHPYQGIERWSLQSWYPVEIP